MKLQDLLLSEDIEVGGDQIYKTRDKVITHRASGQAPTVQKEIVGSDKIGQETMKSINAVILYLKKIGNFSKISKLDYKTPDIQFKSNGDAIVNFDNGGSIIVPYNRYIKALNRH